MDEEPLSEKIMTGKSQSESLRMLTRIGQRRMGLTTEAS